MSDVYGGPKGSITNQFAKTQNNISKHKPISRNTNQFTKTQNNFSKTQTNFSKHKSVYRNTKQFLKTQTNFPKHKSVYRNTKQFLKTQTNFPETQIKRLGTCVVIIRESLEGTHSQDFPRPTWRLLLCCGRFNENVLP